MREDERGKIRHRERARQLRDFTGLRWGTITPTDIDGFIDFNNRLFVYIETKYSEVDVSYGQKLALARQCDAAAAAGIIATVLIVEHDTPAKQDIDVAACPVREYRWDGQWEEPCSPITCRGAIDKLRAKVEPPL